MNRVSIKIYAGIIYGLATGLLVEAEAETVRSRAAATRWEHAMVSGNGATGIMVYGEPYSETVVVNHERCWVPTSNLARKVADMREPIRKARFHAQKGNFGWTELALYNALSNWNIQNYPKENLQASFFAVKGEAGSDKVHPAFQMRWVADEKGAVENYVRETDLDSGEVKVTWQNEAGLWQRSAFVSRPDDVVVWRMAAPEGKTLNGLLSWEDILDAKSEGDTQEVKVEYGDNDLYFYAAYGKTLGRPQREGYHAAGRVICLGGTSRQTADGIRVENARELLLLMRFEFLMDVAARNRAALSAAVEQIDPSYEALKTRHAAIHGEMLRRVQVDFGGQHGKGRFVEDMLREAEERGMTPELLELLHDLGRYALISSSGDFPPALMGIWSGNWNPAWTGHYTFNSNLQLAISAANAGNLPEAMASYVNLIETMIPDWETNARQLFGARGYHCSVGSSWRAGSGLSDGTWFAMTGAAAWLASYYHEYYLCSGDEAFLIEKEIPLLKNIALFGHDYLKGTEGKDGRYLFYPSVSPESIPDRLGKSDIRTYIAPNATSEIAMYRFVYRTLIEECSRLGIEAEQIPVWKEVLAKLPDYYINEDGAMAEWSHPDIVMNYNNKHCSQFFGLYPGLEIDAYETPEWYQGIKRGMELRAGLSNLSGHGILHDCFFYARLKDPQMYWQRLNLFPQERFFYSSLLSAHFPNEGVYNLDTTLALPAVIMEMLVTSRPGSIQLLPVVDFELMPSGSFSGIRTKSGIEIEQLTWNMDENRIGVTLKSRSVQTVQLSIPFPIEEIRSISGQVEISDSERGDDWRIFKMPKGSSSFDLIFDVSDE